MTRPKSAEELIAEFAHLFSRENGTVPEPSAWLRSALDSYREHLIEKAMPKYKHGGSLMEGTDDLLDTEFNNAIDEFADNLRKV